MSNVNDSWLKCRCNNFVVNNNVKIKLGKTHFLCILFQAFL